MGLALADLVCALRRTPDTPDALLGGLDDGWSRHRPAPGEWSAADVVGHLIHGERTDWIPRARIILEFGPARPFDPFDREGSAELAAHQSTPALLASFRELRQASLATLREWNLTETDLDREGKHPSFGIVHLGEHLATWVTHDHVHLAQLSQALASRYVGEVGPWREYLWES